MHYLLSRLLLFKYLSLFFSNMFPSNLVQATFQQVSYLTSQTPFRAKAVFRTSVQVFCASVSLPWQQYRTSSEYVVKPKPTVSQAQSESTTRRALIYGIQDDNGTDIQNFALDLTPPPDVLIRTREGTSDGMNVLGIVIFSATMGE